MKNLFKTVGLVAVAAFFGTSCQSNLANVEPEPSKDGEVTFTSTVNSRATASNFEAGDEISVTAIDNDGTFFAENVKYTYESNVFTSKAPIKIKDDKSMAYRAVYPYSEVAQDGSLSFSVSKEQGTGSNYTNSDLMSAFVGATVSTKPSLTFNHLLSQVVVNIKNSDVETFDAKVQFKALSSADYNILTNECNATGSPELIATDADGVGSFKAVVVPQRITAFEAFFYVTIGEDVYEVNFFEDKYFKVGKKYEYDITIQDGSVTYEETINDWEPDPNPDEPALDGKTICNLDYNTLVEAMGYDLDANLNGTAIGTVEFEHYTLTSKGGSTPFGVWSSDKTMRSFDGNTVTITGNNGATIKKVEFSHSALFNPSAGTCSGSIWTGNAKEVTFSLGEASNRYVIITVAQPVQKYYIAGEDLKGKTWKFAGTTGDKLWWFMSAPNAPDDYMTTWWDAGESGLCPADEAGGTMTFDIDGGMHITHTTAEGVVTEGTFGFNGDYSELLVPGPATILASLANGVTEAHTSYMVCELTESRMVLYVADCNATGWTWVFVPAQ